MKRFAVLAAAVALAAGCAAPDEAPVPEDAVADYARSPGPAAFEELYLSLRGTESDSLAAAIDICRLHLAEIERCLDTLRLHHGELDRRCRRHFAQVQLDMGRTREAARLFEQLCAEEPDYACPFHKLGIAYRDLGRLGESLDCLRRSAELAPDHRSCFDDLARTLIALGRPGEALEAFEEGCRNSEIAPGDPDRESLAIEAEFLYLDLLERCGRGGEAAAQLARLRREAPGDRRLAGYD